MDPHWIALAFGTVNSIRVVFYLPQIVAVARSTSGARDIALSTWAMWALTNGLGAAYGAVVVHDSLLALSFAVSSLACVLTMVLTLVQRMRWARGLRPNGPPRAVHSPSAS
jgi:predicted MFS family arabinose efflux permease